MITEDYVSFETAKLLKKKGFDEDTIGYYYTLSETPEKIKFFDSPISIYYSDGLIGCIHAPTLQMTMKWLRKTHNLFIGINTVIGSDKNWGYEVFIQKQEIPIPSKMQWDWFNSYEEACEAAIKYCLENLI